MMNKVLIADEHPITRLSVRMLLAQEGFEVVAEAGNDKDALFRFKLYQPDVVILDMAINQVDAITVIRQLKVMPLPPAVIVFTAQDSPFLPARCFRAGADGYVNKTAEIDELVKALRGVQSGYKYFPAQTFGLGQMGDEQQLFECLSPREIQVLQQLVKGLRNKDIAAQMLLSGKTVSTYKRRLLTKFQVGNLVDLISIAKHGGWPEGGAPV